MSTPAPRIAVVEHQASCPPGLVGRWLTDAGCELEVSCPYLGEALPDLTAYDGVLVLGGEMGADDDALHPWLGPLKEQIRAVVEYGTPLLGICLGHQLIGSALGGQVVKNPRCQTVGLQPIGWTDAAADDDLVADNSGEERSIHWNGDIVADLPSGAELLAISPGGEAQVVRYGPRAWGIQAHPEADVAVVRHWAAADRDDHVSLGIDQDAVLADIDAAAPELERHWRPIAQRFARLAGA